MNQTPSPSSDIEERDSSGVDMPNLFGVAALLLRERRLILGLTLLGAVLAGTGAFVRARSWSSGFSFVPQRAAVPGGGLASLAGQFGINVAALSGGDQPPEFFVAALQTRDVLIPVLKDSLPSGDGDGTPIAVLDYLEVKGASEGQRIERGLRKLRNDVLSAGVADRQVGIVRVQVKTSSAVASTALAELMLASLNAFNVRTRQGQAAEERRFAQERLDSASAALAAAEDELRLFSERNRDRSNSAALSLQFDRLQRLVSQQQQLYSVLAQQFEEARLREVRDTPILNLVERPYVPQLPDSRMAAIVLVAGTLASAVLAVLLVLGREMWRGHLANAGDSGLRALREEWARTRVGGAADSRDS